MIEEANKVFRENYDNKAWYGRCIFLSWYCDKGTCKFCFRSTIKHKIKHSNKATRTKESVVVEAILCKALGWRVEFLTGGYGIFPIEELVEITKLVSEVYGEKIWLNLGVISKEDLEKFRPYVKGIVSSIETVEPILHKEMCPDKDIEPYEDMFEYAEGFRRSMTMVIGLGEKKEDFDLLEKFIEKHQLDRITFYALKPVTGSPFTKGPETEDYIWWIAKTRIRFPKLEIIAGTTARRYEEVGRLLEAGANAFTKFPATRKFGTKEAYRIEEDIKKVRRELVGTITKLPDLNWDKEVEKLNLDKEFEIKVKEKLKSYLGRLSQTSS
ncbi:radical SAM protein [archaeon]|jgi:biotin synthase-like enzyme|nr:radical SAM protein [archaeon]MBT3730799.1 radical SAM protein [archaeon]MBT4670113.1 radical SAM protein [archaeon]MBT5030586.1 radical SAM protein [archaeon]MBT5287939.1 radical SAM protein [archaeon]